jgi:hypothetical protein
MIAPQVTSLEAASQLFDTQVTLQYQNMQRFQGCVDERHGTVGTTLNIPISDLIEMQQSNFAPANIPITRVEETNVPVVTNDYRVKTVIGGGERTLFNFDKITSHSILHAKAAARMDDFVRLNAIYSDPNFGSIEVIPSTVGVNTGINSSKMAEALSYLEGQGVDVLGFQTSMWAPALLKKSMLADDRVVNSFYNDVKPLTDNVIQGYLDIDCRFVGENGINRIPSTGVGPAVYLVPVIHKDCIVQSYNRDISANVVWVQQEDRWELLTTFTTGAKIIQLNGIVLMTVNDPFATP